MASNTKQTQFRRNLRKKNAGRDRKRSLEVNGTTPAFPVHTPEADANAPAEARPE
jgi:hypothetical protein